MALELSFQRFWSNMNPQSFTTEMLDEMFVCLLGVESLHCGVVVRALDL